MAAPGGDEIPAAQRCRAKGCARRRIGSGELCAEHFNERLFEDRDLRERARGAQGHWANWAGELGGGEALETHADPVGGAAPAGAPTEGAALREALAPAPDPAPEPSAEALRADLRRRARRAEARDPLPPWLAMLGPNALLQRLESATRFLPPDLEARAWRAAHAAAEGSVLDPERLVEAAHDPLGAIGRAIEAGAESERHPAADGSPEPVEADGAPPPAPSKADPPDPPAPAKPEPPDPPAHAAAEPRGPAPDRRLAEPAPRAGVEALLEALGGAAARGLSAFAGEVTRAASAEAARGARGDPRAEPVEPSPQEALGELARTFGGTFGRAVRASTEVFAEAAPELFGIAGRTGEAIAEGASVGLQAAEAVLGRVVGSGEGLGERLAGARKRSRSAAEGFLRPFVPGLDLSLRARDLRDAARASAAWLRRRVVAPGDHEDGYDPELFLWVGPALAWVVQRWFRLDVKGLEHVPASGAALIVCNQAGLSPLAGLTLAALGAAERADRSAPAPAPGAGLGRAVRPLVPSWVLSRALGGPVWRRLGMVALSSARAEHLLADGALCAGFPEGAPAFSKPFRRRGDVLPFVERSLFEAAVRQGAPVVPCAIQGLEEAQPVLGRSGRAGRALGLPTLPLTPTFPWLGPAGLVPLPVRCRVRFGPPLEPGGGGERAGAAGAADDLARRSRAAVVALLGS